MRTRPALKNDARWLLVALVTLLPAAPLTAHADPATSVDMPFDTTTFNPCNFEEVLVSGAVHGVTRMSFDGAGGVHVEEELNLQDVSGLDSLGNEYRFTQNLSTTMNGKVGMEITSTFTEVLVSEGSAPNFLVHLVFHMTINPDGTVTSLVELSNGGCT